MGKTRIFEEFGSGFVRVAEREGYIIPHRFSQIGQDGTHPNNNGMAVLAEMLIQEMR